MSDPLREGEAVVAGESESLARGGGVEGDVGRDDDDEDHAGEAVDAGRVDGGAEDVDEGEAGGVGEGVVDVVDREEVRD